MNPEKLIINAQLKGRNSGKLVAIEDYQPAFNGELQRWLVKGHWLNYAQLEARYSLYDPTRKAPKKKGAVAHG